jgi:diguanylate cyclase (GGDEF)-like protein
MDPQALFLLSILIMLLNGGVLGLMHESLAADVRAAAVDWRVGTLVLAGGMALLAAQGLGSMALLLPAGNAMLCAACLLYWRSLRRFAGEPDPPAWTWLPLVCVAAAVWWFSAVRPSFSARVASTSPVIAGYLLAAAWTGVREARRGGETSLRVLTGVIGLVGAFILARAAYVLLAGDQGTTFVSPASWLNIATILVTAILPVIGTTAFLVMCSERARRRAEHAAATDYLTGLANRRTLTMEGNDRFAAARAGGTPWNLAVVLLDVDHFKAVNDRHGHAIGDAALKHVAEILKRHRRAGDLAGRQGGEEFAMLLAVNDRDEARAAAERLRAALVEAPFETGGGPLTITASFGVAAMTPDDADFDAMLKRADQALYRAKANGRNRVEA